MTPVAAVAIAPFDAQAAEAAAAIRTRLDAAGTPIGPIDTQIAAIAASTSATLVTRNVREFSRIAGLSLENWYTEPVA
ncbi:MAG: PIN domain-containing protein [Burkholderiaceae bacterium]|nr:PIN domain-containing protein [Burkholderiaceae bacterium]